jgi:hypothetical protein
MSWGREADPNKPMPDCTRCRKPGMEMTRERWGCDAPAKYPVFTISCSKCSGNDPKCECGGTDRAPVFRCPTATLSSAHPEVMLGVKQFMRAYAFLESRQILPAAGGLNDQSLSFVQACEIVDAERGLFDKIRQETAERERKVREKKAQMGRGR